MDFVDRLDQFLLAGLSLFLQNINLGFHNKKSPRARSGPLAQDTPESHIRATLLELIAAPAVDTCRRLHLLDRPSSSPPSNEACSPQVLAPHLISSTFGKIKGKSGRQSSVIPRRSSRAPSLCSSSSSMASILNLAGAGLSSSVAAPGRSRDGGFAGAVGSARTRRVVSVRAEARAINPEIRKSEEKVVDSVVVAELSKPLTAYCRCWRSGTFPLCDGSHVKHNKATGDNVGPLLLKKQKE
ncbi:hypothetical protein NL676_000111 [Syzygium grande]|nr:hypothetical protein NL676_000111 [Syzygium grande]